MRQLVKRDSPPIFVRVEAEQPLAAEKLVLIVPGKRLPIGAERGSERSPDLTAIHCVIVASVLVFVANSTAYLETHFRRNGHVSEIEQTMKVSPQQYAVGGPMIATR